MAGNRRKGKLPSEPTWTDLRLSDIRRVLKSLEDPQKATVFQSEAPARTTVVVTPTFKMIFFTVVALTVLAGLAQVGLAVMYENPTINQQAVFEGMGFAWKSGIGAIFGLLTGKVT